MVRESGSVGEAVLLSNQTAGVKIFPNGALFIRTARKSIQGRYTCRAVNNVGQELTSTIAITVNAAPRFKETLSRLSVKRDDAAVMECRVEGDMPLLVAWRRSSSSPSVLTNSYRLVS